MLAEIGALSAFGHTRREALWQVERAIRPAGSCSRNGQGRGTRDDGDDGTDGRAGGRREAGGGRRLLSVAAMSAIERVVADYEGTGLTIGPHPMAMRRDEMRLRGALRASDLPRQRHGRRVRVAGAVITRQRPGTAKGFVFLTLEDETGIANIIIRPDLFAEQKLTIINEPFLLVEGMLQNQDGVTSVRAERMTGVGGARLEIEARDFYYRPPLRPRGLRRGRLLAAKRRGEEQPKLLPGHVVQRVGGREHWRAVEHVAQVRVGVCLARERGWQRRLAAERRLRGGAVRAWARVVQQPFNRRRELEHDRLRLRDRGDRRPVEGLRDQHPRPVLLHEHRRRIPLWELPDEIENLLTPVPGRHQREVDGVQRVRRRADHESFQALAVGQDHHDGCARLHAGQLRPARAHPGRRRARCRNRQPREREEQRHNAAPVLDARHRSLPPSPASAANRLRRGYGAPAFSSQSTARRASRNRSTRFLPDLEPWAVSPEP